MSWETNLSFASVDWLPFVFVAVVLFAVSLKVSVSTHYWPMVQSLHYLATISFSFFKVWAVDTKCHSQGIYGWKKGLSENGMCNFSLAHVFSVLYKCRCCLSAHWIMMLCFCLTFVVGSFRTGHKLVPYWSVQDLLQSWCLGTSWRRARSQTDRDHHCFPGVLPWKHCQEALQQKGAAT